ncbi:MAG: hypothetical protein HRT47_08445 [Candidatus Caenarcaniphilales bacterium]|nr:hypothetical protein [Candidatus Caenarcaniphilales bacterium]
MNNIKNSVLKPAAIGGLTIATMLLPSSDSKTIQTERKEVEKEHIEALHKQKEKLDRNYANEMHRTRCLKEGEEVGSSIALPSTVKSGEFLCLNWSDNINHPKIEITDRTAKLISEESMKGAFIFNEPFMNYELYPEQEVKMRKKLEEDGVRTHELKEITDPNLKKRITKEFNKNNNKFDVLPDQLLYTEMEINLLEEAKGKNLIIFIPGNKLDRKKRQVEFMIGKTNNPNILKVIVGVNNGSPLKNILRFSSEENNIYSQFVD